MPLLGGRRCLATFTGASASGGENNSTGATNADTRTWNPAMTDLQYMTQRVAQIYVDRQLEDYETYLMHEGRPITRPLTPIEKHQVRVAAMDQFNAWLKAIKEQP